VGGYYYYYGLIVMECPPHIYIFLPSLLRLLLVLYSITVSFLGICRYYCPPGSYRANQNECGNSSVFCPISSGAPTTVKAGYYSIGDVGINTTHPWLGVVRTRTSQLICPRGYYCTGGEMFKCPPGFYGESVRIDMG